MSGKIGRLRYEVGSGAQASRNLKEKRVKDRRESTQCRDIRDLLLKRPVGPPLVGTRIYTHGKSLAVRRLIEGTAK